MKTRCECLLKDNVQHKMSYWKAIDHHYLQSFIVFYRIIVCLFPAQHPHLHCKCTSRSYNCVFLSREWSNDISRPRPWPELWERSISTVYREVPHYLSLNSVSDLYWQGCLEVRSFCFFLNYVWHPLSFNHTLLWAGIRLKHTCGIVCHDNNWEWPITYSHKEKHS